MKKPEQVFTPRPPDLNEDMYIPRPELESNLRQALRSGVHIVIHGESGSGKTWLYKKVLNEDGYSPVVANLANASRFGSINEEFKNLLSREEKAEKTSFTEKKGVSSGIELSHEGEYEIGKKEPFEKLLSVISNKSKKGKGVLILDNLESIREQAKLMRELANMITLLDDSRYSEYAVKVIIVGVPSDLRSYFLETPNLATVANRLREVPEVSRMTRDQAKALVLRGFKDHLRYSLPDEETIADHCVWVTDRLPQRLHEYCLELAFLSEDSKTVEATLLNQSDRRWLSNSLAANVSVIESMMNERDTKVGRRNQALFSLGTFDGEEFRWSDIEAELRRNFPESTKDKSLNLAQILSGLSLRENPIVRRSPKGDSYSFVDPKYRMCLRTMLEKQLGETVRKVNLS